MILISDDYNLGQCPLFDFFPQFGIITYSNVSCYTGHSRFTLFRAFLT
jgi:hypothetical protein